MTLDPFRLPRTVLPRHYQVTLVPELELASFSGSVTIDADATEAIDAIVMNAIELTIDAVLVDGVAAPFQLDDDTERLFIDCSHPAGNLVISIEFRGVLNDKLRGFYRSTYRDEDGVEHVIACSQMQATDCRRAFPCFDEPEFKASFGVTLVVEEDLLAISNGPEISRTPTETGCVAVTFEDTMPMSTYLVCFVVGRLEVTEPVDVGGIPLRIVHVPGKGHLTDFGLEVGAATLSWFQDYYGIAYPGTKVDMVALPDFAAGAMENFGCITYRESLLLVDPESSTQHEQQIVADVISHELAHMWFGDLVTMRWWNGIWLNEAFATFMEVMAVDELRPDWERWTSFSLERTDAFEVDSLASTRTVEFAVHAPSDCEGMFDVLTYQKGAALLRMLQQYLGDERFRNGVNNYLRLHSYANTETSDLWDGIETITSADHGNEPVREMMDSWIWQAGFPLVSAALVGDELVLRQERFSFQEEAVDPTLFIVPVAVRVGSETQTVLLDGAERSVTIGPDQSTIVVNAGGHGFYRVAYDDSLRARLGIDALTTLNTVERYTLVDDAGASFVAGRLPAAALLAFLEGFSGERELAVWQIVIATLRRLNRLIDGDALEPFRSSVRQMVGAALAELGWEPQPGETDLQSKLRGLLVTTIAVLGNDLDAQRHCREILEGRHDNSDPELVSAATTVVATAGDADDFERFVDGFRAATTPQEQLRNLYALAEFDDAELIRRTCEFAFSGEVRTQNAPFLLHRCIANRNHGELAWTYVRQHWTVANELFPNASIVRMIDSVKLLHTPEAVADVQGFFSEHPIKQSTTTLAQVLERQRVNADVRAREADAFVKALLGA